MLWTFGHHYALACDFVAMFPHCVGDADHRNSDEVLTDRHGDK